jgi:hypothetical protein
MRLVGEVFFVELCLVVGIGDVDARCAFACGRWVKWLLIEAGF